MPEAGLYVARFLHYAAAMALFGVSLFPLYAFPSRADSQPSRFHSWNRTFLFRAAVVTFLAGILWLAFATATMSGSLSAAIDPDALGSVLNDTAFGRVWMARLGLSALLVGLTALAATSANGDSPAALTTLAAAAVLATLAGAGHTMHTEGMASVVHIVSDGAHLLAAGAWFGGLLALSFVLITATPDASTVLRRFSGMGYAAVAALAGSGLINSWFLVGSVSNLTGSPYGQLLLVKLALFAGMLGLALANRFWLVPALSSAPSHGALAATEQLRRHVLAEQVLGFLVILIVSVLGTMEPAIGH